MQLASVEPTLMQLCVQRSDMMSAQRLCNLTSEVLHSLSHAYHHVSDLMVDMSRTPPRNLRAPPPMPTTAIIQQTIPVQVSIVSYFVNGYNYIS